MKLNGLLLLVAAAVFLPLVSFYFATQAIPPAKTFSYYKFQITAPPQSGGAELKLTGGSLAKLGVEVAEIIRKQAPFLELHNPAVSLRKGMIQVIYLGDAKMPDSLQKNIEDYIIDRIPQLVKEQGSAS